GRAASSNRLALRDALPILLTAFKLVGYTIVHKRKDRDWKYQLELERTMDIVNNIRALDLVETKVDLNDYRRYLVFAKTKEDFLTDRKSTRLNSSHVKRSYA